MAATMPTRGATEDKAHEWAGHPLVARVLRAIVWVAPILSSWLVVRSTSGLYWRPAGHAGFVAWLAQVVVIGSVTVVLVGRASRRLLPLAALYTLTIAFPDAAPSRFRVALRSGNLRTVQARFQDVRAHGLGDDTAVAMSSLLEMVAALSKHEPRTRGHTDRVRAYTDMLGEEMGLDAAERDKLRWAAMLHDIGKLSVPAEILNKAGRPTEEEWRTLVRHPLIGAEIVEELAGWLGDWRFAARDHHERWDGKGYPRGLAGEEISLAGRIVAVADAYDVITSARSYKKPMSAEAARRELVRCAGTQFDPAVVRAFLNLSIGRTSKAGMVGWLLEVPRGLANLASQGASAASGVVAASSIAAVAAVATVAPPPAPVAAPVDHAEVVAAPATTEPPAPVAAAREEPPPSVAPRATAPDTPVAEVVPEPVPTTTAAPTTTVRAVAPATTAPRPTAAPTTTRGPAAPNARDDLWIMRAAQSDDVPVLLNDDDPDRDLDPSTLTVVSASDGLRGAVVSGKIRVTAPAGSGDGTVRYRVCDRGGRCDTASVYVVWG